MFVRFLLLAVALSLTACGQSEDAGKPTRDPALFARGGRAFARLCMTCHSVDLSTHGAGPHLVALGGREAGSLKGFAYSPAMRASGIVWNAEILDRYLAGPEKMVPGTIMLTAQVDDPEEREALIHYLLQH